MNGEYDGSTIKIVNIGRWPRIRKRAECSCGWHGYRWRDLDNAMNEATQHANIHTGTPPRRNPYKSAVRG